jgi:hypothetical protein
MIPFCFPITYIPDTFIGIVQTHFPKILVYQPSARHVPPSLQRLQKAGALEIRTPVGDEERLEKLLGACRKWLLNHQGSDLTSLGEKIFDDHDGMLFEEQFTSQIKSAIKKSHKKGPGTSPDPLFAARFFLLTAQEFDFQQDELGKTLNSLSDAENELFAVLKGDKTSPGEFQRTGALLSPAEDPGSHMPEQRLTAWFRVFETDPDHPAKIPECLLITPSQTVFQAIRERIPEGAPTLLIDHLPTALKDPSEQNSWHAELSKYLSDWMNHPETTGAPAIPAGVENRVAMHLVLLDGKLAKPVFSGDTELPSVIGFDRLAAGFLEIR